ncbi:MAG: hypothetical protein N4A46_09800 [Schleiferiaceae bacterium]|jgi:hypothetical protein|nr:hypothetical protein [Schleiferiaceae bacterium]
MKKIIALIAVVSFGLAIGFSDARADKPKDKNCCPPGWTIKCGTSGTANNASKDNNGDDCLCRKDIPGKNANGNNQGNAAARNWKDNNHPCD